MHKGINLAFHIRIGSGQYLENHELIENVAFDLNDPRLQE